MGSTLLPVPQIQGLPQCPDVVLVLPHPGAAAQKQVGNLTLLSELPRCGAGNGVWELPVVDEVPLRFLESAFSKDPDVFKCA